MSDNETPTPATPVMTSKEFGEAYIEAKQDRLRQGLRSGPMYVEPGGAPLVWFDQAFEREISPSDTLVCQRPLRVGSTNNGLDILLVASHANSTAVQAASGATVTLSLLQADREDGTFTEVGPSICVKAPSSGIAAEPDTIFARFAIGNFQKPWLKAKLEFSGTFSGGTLDCCLGYMPR